MTRAEILTYITRLDGWLSRSEGCFLYEAARKSSEGEIVEIGSWMGKSTICLAAGSKESGGAKVTAVDPHKGEFSWGKGLGKKAPTFKKFKKNLEKANVANWVKPLIATSKDAAKKWKKHIRLLFIDGLHDYKHTKQDFSFWSPFVLKDGMLAFHDAFCGHEGPEKVILELFKNKNYSGFGVVGSIIYVKKQRAKTILEMLDRKRNTFFISLALFLNKQHMPRRIQFFLIHRIIKLFLLNTYSLHMGM